MARGLNSKGSDSFTPTAMSGCGPCKHELPNWNINSGKWAVKTRVPRWRTRAQGDSLYPSIRKLPLLGVTYADLYRKTKVAGSGVRDTDARV